ncbi:DsbA family protein [Octadecabacter sp. R77987]|uniref:DsbA family protein n=1 Tax=Octadecabacter sp. R77987 TaxID=3093874 RepID=UPI003672C658
MKTRNTILAVVLAAMPFGALADTLDEDRVKELVLEAIRENPQIVMEAVEILQRRDAEAQAELQAETLTNQRLLLEQDPNAPVLGNPDGDVTVIEFFDYNCPYCRQAMSEVQGLLDADPNVRLVYREWPILGDGSVFAARAALASRNQGKYEEFHWALMGMDGRAEEASVMRIANQVGLDIDRLLADMQSAEIDAHLAESTRLSQALGFNGTPSFVIGDELLPGFVEEALLLEVVQQTRDEGQ